MDVGQMQRKLSQRAEREPDHRFGTLYSLLCNRDWLTTAYAHVRTNAGSKTAGVDGVTRRQFEENLEQNLEDLRASLKAKTWEPQPVKRCIIREKKTEGRIKARRLGIPTFLDRVVQEAVRMVLEPIYEADFSRHSYGFRPNRRTMDAVCYIRNRLVNGQSYGWVVEGDIASCFDTIPHRKLMQCLRRRIQDETFLHLIWRFLRAGVMEGMKIRHSLMGTPQGGIASPILANIYLHELDRYMEQYTEMGNHPRSARKQKGQPNFLYVRYADDFAVLCDGSKEHAEAMKQELSGFLATHLKLELSWEKTKVTHVKEGFSFLGYHIERNVGTTGRLVPKLRIPKAAMDKFRSKVDVMLCGAPNDSVNVKIQALNRVIRGWCQYYQITSSPSFVFRRLEYEIFWKMAHWLGRKYKLSMPRVMRKFRKGNTFGTKTTTLVLPTQYKAKRYRARKIPNAYTSEDQGIVREEVVEMEDAWTGRETRSGTADLKEEIYVRDGGRCGLCGKWTPWHEAEIDHIKPRHTFPRKMEADAKENLRILHREPCHRNKTKTDLQAGAV